VPTDDTVTVWLDRLRTGEPAAAQKLWASYFERLVHLVRRHIQGLPRRAADEEDVALSAFDSFCRGAGAGRYPDLNDRHDLWRLLVAITEHKALRLIEYERRLKRDYRKTRHASALPEDDPSGGPGPLAGLPGREPDPRFAAEVADRCRALLAQLPNDRLRLVAVRKMEGYTHDEIARELGCSVMTVQRKLALIRKIWRAEATA
jgi:RNA polymerase sigma factor (sigma-70 family)